MIEGISIHALRELLENTLYLENNKKLYNVNEHIKEYDKDFKKANKQNKKVEKYYKKIQKLKSKIAKIYGVEYGNNL